MSREKIRSHDEMVAERARLRERGLKLVFTNGCFDLLHAGHIRYLREARALGDRLLVAVNADETVAVLKGEGRPLVPLAERMEILAALEAVDYVTEFAEETPATIIDALVPDVLVKGGDWSKDRIVGRDRVEAAGGSVHSLPFAPGFSTSSLVERILERMGGKPR